MPELWQPIEGFEGVYEVSNQGRVRSLDRLVPAKAASLATRKGKILKQRVTHKGYREVYLRRSTGYKIFKVHRLVALAFVEGDCSLTVNHKDLNKQNNCAENLEWATHSEQRIHYLRSLQ